MLTNEQEKSLNFLRGLDKIIIPRNWTYWNHDTMFKPAEFKQAKNALDARCWNSIPTDRFVTNQVMSFRNRTERIKQCLDNHGSISVGYSPTSDSLLFQIRVLQPKETKIKELFNSDQEIKIRKSWYCGIPGTGNSGHPKLPVNEEVCVFASANYDEVSGEKIDVIYCVLARDVEQVAKEVKQELIVNNNLKYTTNITIENNKYAKENDGPVVLKKDTDLTRLRDIGITKEGIKPAGYKLDYYKNLKKPQM